MTTCDLKVNGCNCRTGLRKTKAAVLPHMWKIDPKDKNIQKKINMFVIVEYSMQLGEERKRKEKDRASAIL
jgi:hypothetical protein